MWTSRGIDQYAILLTIGIGFLEAGIDNHPNVNDTVRPSEFVLANDEENEDEGMEEDEAVEYFNFNIADAFHGSNTPVIINNWHDTLV